MKNKLILTAIIIILACVYTFGQDNNFGKKYFERKAGDYIKMPGMDKFVGTWIWQEGNSSFKLVLVAKKKVPMEQNRKKPYFLDYIVGGYIYIQDGKEVVNTISYIETKPVLEAVALKNYVLEGGFNTIESYFGWDISPRVSLQPGKSKNMIIWTTSGMPDDYEKVPVFNVPRHIVLTKVD